MSITASSKSLETLLGEVWTGRIQAPAFQRDYVWSPDQILDLLESIRRNVPLGAITLWEEPELENSESNPGFGFEPLFYRGDDEKRLVGLKSWVENKGKPDKSSKSECALFSEIEADFPAVSRTRFGVVDGRQRLTSLMYALGGIRESDKRRLHSGYWVLDLDKPFDGGMEDKTPFELVKSRGNKNVPTTLPEWLKRKQLPLWFWNCDQVLQKIGNPDNYEDTVTAEDRSVFQSRFQEFQGVVRNVQFAVIQLESTKYGLDGICEIFERINKSGTTVSIEDILHARMINESNSRFDLRQELSNFVVGRGKDSLESKDQDLLARFMGHRTRDDELRTDRRKFVLQCCAASHLWETRKGKPGMGLPESMKRSQFLQFSAKKLASDLDLKSDYSPDTSRPKAKRMASNLRRFVSSTRGCLGYSLCPYPALIPAYLGIADGVYEVSESGSWEEAKTQKALDCLDRFFRVYFWRTVFLNSYQQGTETSVPSHVRKIVKFLTEDMLSHIEDDGARPDAWWPLASHELEQSLDRKLPANKKDTTQELRADLLNQDLPSGARRKMCELLSWVQAPKNLKPESAGRFGPLHQDLREDKEWHYHHFFPKNWAKQNIGDSAAKECDCAANKIPLSGKSNRDWLDKDPKACLEDWNTGTDTSQIAAVLATVGVVDKAKESIWSADQSKTRLNDFLSHRADTLADTAWTLMLAGEIATTAKFEF